MSFSKILLFILIAFISSKNVVIIGDSRVCGFAYSILGMDYTWHNSVYGTGSYIISNTAKSYGGHSIKVVAEVSASCYTFKNSNKEVYKGVHNILQNSPKDTVVLMWLGVNNLDVGCTFDYYLNLAKQYKNLIFYGVSVSGVSSKADVTNTQIQKFNSQLKQRIVSEGISYFKYKSILYQDDPTKIYNAANDKVTFRVTEDTTDIYGVHYQGNGDREVLLAMLAKI